MKQLLLLFLFTIGFCQAQEIEFDIYFDLGKFRLTSNHKNKIDEKLADLDTTITYNFIVKGFTDFIDNEDFNLKLSQNRAIAVVEYLQRSHVSLINSVEKEAKGELPTEGLKQNKKLGVKEHRKVSISVSKNDHKPKVASRKENIYVVPLSELRIGSSYALGKINFKTSRVTLVKSSRKELEKLVRFLKKNRNIRIEIQGHVCCGGNQDGDALNSDTGTFTLSVDRAEYIYKYLISRGIAEDRLTYKGYAFSAPLHFPEKGSRDRGANRRVEIMITQN